MPRPSQNPAISKIEDGLYLGDIESSYKIQILQAYNISAIVSVTAGGLAYWRRDLNRQIVSEDRHLYIPCQDSSTHNLLPELARICDFIDHHRRHKPSNITPDLLTTTTPPSEGYNILVHCEMGVSRSATVLIAYVMRAYRWSFLTALTFVEEKRKVRPNSNFKDQLHVWEQVEYEIWEDQERKIPKVPYAAFLKKRTERLVGLGLTGDEPIVPDL